MVRSLPQLRQSIRASYADGSAFSMMVGIGETYVPAFIIAIGLGETNSGLIATIPYFAGALLQMISPTMVKLLRSYRRWILICASLQGLTFVPLIVAAITGKLSAAAAFFIAAVYWGAGLGIGGAWNAWITTLIPPRTRTPFLARRNRYIQMASLVGFLAGGVILHSDLHSAYGTSAFAVLFLAAFISRIVSVFWIHRQAEHQPPHPSRMRQVSIGELLKGKLLVYMLGVQLAINLCSPFFTPFMINHLKLSYPAYAGLIAAAFLAKVIALPFLGRFARRQGVMALLWFGGTGIVFNPFLWIWSTNYIYLFVGQMIIGVFWAAYELATPLLVIEQIHEHEKISLVTNYNFLNSLVMAVGSLVGASILEAMNNTPTAYYLLFGFSTVARASTLLLLRRIPSTNRQLPRRILDVSTAEDPGTSSAA